MIVTIHQPSYLPWLPFLEKALRSDVFVFLDDVQFEKNSEQNRNRIKTPKGPLWMTIPVNRKLHTLIPDVRILEDGGRWRKKHINSIRQHYGKAPYYDDVSRKLFELLGRPWKRLLDINIAVDELFFKMAGFDGKVVSSSDLSVSSVKSERILEICKTLGATVYLSGAAGADYMNIPSFAEAGIEVRIQAYEHHPYPQLYPETGFLSRLSALDLFFNLGAGEKAREIIVGGGRWINPPGA